MTGFRNNTAVVFAYLSSAIDTTIGIADRWYVFNGVFTNELNKGFGLDSDGITSLSANGLYRIDFMAGGVSDKSADIKIGIVKNGTFIGGVLDASESILSGSGGKDFADTVAQSNGECNPRCYWVGNVEVGDKLTLVITSSDDNTVFTPDEANATIHKITE